MSVRGVGASTTRTAHLQSHSIATVRRVPLVGRQRAVMAAGSQQHLHALLLDIFHFLSENLSGEMLSDTADKGRKALLEKLSCIFPDLPSTYLDMNGKSHCDEEYIVSDVTESIKEPNNCPDSNEEKYSNLPNRLSEVALKNTSLESSGLHLNICYKELCSKAVKYGPLLRRERLFFMDQYRRCWAGLQDHNLLVYTSERDTKPFFSLDVQGFSAHPSANTLGKEPKKKDLCFEIVCPGQKTYHFVARTTKDMDQWVAAISQASGYELCWSKQKQLQPLRKLPSLPHEEVQDNYDDIATFNDSEEEIYHDISDIQAKALMEDSLIPANSNSPLKVGDPEQKGGDIVEEDEAIYDDVNSILAVKDTAFVADLNKLQTQRTAKVTSVSQTETTIGEKYQDDLEIYDDVAPKIVVPKPKKLSSWKSNLRPVDKALHDEISASFLKIQKNSSPSKVELIQSIKSDSSEELYESIENPNS